MKKMGKLRKSLIAGLALLGLAGAALAPLKVANNIMSNCGYNETSASYKLKKPSTYLTKGPYKGFVNTYLFPSLNESDENDPHDFDPDPLNNLPKEEKNIDLNAIYLRLQSNPLPRSSFKPNWINENNDDDFYSIRDFIHKPERIVGENLSFSEKSLERILSLKEGETVFSGELEEKNPIALDFTNVDLHEYTLGFGKDKKGIYTELYDVWDFEPSGGYFNKFKDKTEVKIAGKILPLIGKPIKFYDRIYWKDNSVNE